MANNMSIFRKVALIIGIFIFSVLAVSTIVERSFDEDYIGFQIFRTHLRINRFIIRDSSYLSELEDKTDQDTIIHEIDLSFYIFKDSSFFTIYRSFNKPYNQSVTYVEQQWELFKEVYFNNDVEEGELLREYLFNVIDGVEVLQGSLSSIVYVWSIYYTIVLALNLLALLFLLIRVFVNNKEKDSKSNIGIMSVRNALIEGQEKERLRISLELHDKVAQDLFACRMLIKDISSTTKDESITLSITNSLSLLDASIKEVRDLSYSLRPPALQAIGLDSAMQSYIDNFSGKIEIPITFKATGITNKNIDETVSINLYRILQETLNNTAKHAHAENIDIKLIYTYPYLLLKIEDDGVGFKYVKSEVKAKGRNKLGLPGINERVSLLNGELIINTDKGEGTKILIRVPVVENEKV